MPNPLITLILIHLGLSAACALYAHYLEHHPGYAPDWIWLTVVGGFSLILAALGLVCLIGILPWQALFVALSLSTAAGIPIVAWQFRQMRQRQAERERDKRR